MSEKLYSLTNPQKSIYLTEEYFNGTNINNISGTITIKQPVNFDKLILAIKQLIKQNDAFRIVLSNEDIKIKQKIADYKDFPIEIIDVASTSELSLLASEIAARPFLLYNSFLFKFVIFRYPDNSGGFVINMHHLIADSWTLGIAINEIIEIYSSYVKNEEFIPKDIDVYSYVNYIKAEQEYINSSKYEKDKEYWNNIFATIPDNATIPSISQNANSNSSINALRKQLSIPADILSRIKEYCTNQKVSVFNFLTAIFSIYISRVSNLEDFCIGTPILNRSNFKEKNTAGMFINTLPLRVSIDNDSYFKDFLNLVATNSMSLLRHQKYSYQNIIEDLRKRQSNLPNLYNIMISYQITKMNREQEEIPHEAIWYFNNTMADDIDIHIFDLNDTNELNIAYDYKVDKYNSEDMQNIHERILNIISQVLENNNIKLSDIEIVTKEEKEKLIYGFNQTKLDYPKNKTVAELFEEQVKLTPNNVAIVFENKSLTYKELNEKANSLAYYLIKEKQIKPHTLVGIMTNRSLEMIIGLLAIIKCGCCYVPIDPEYPSDRIKYMIQNSNASILLTDKKNFGIINNVANIDISINSAIYLSKGDVSFIKKDLSSNDLLYVVYTSGSTGTPKGIMISNENVVNYLYALKKIVHINKYKNFVSVTTMCFDIFVTEIWGCLLNGLSMILANEKQQNVGFELNELCNKYDVDIIQTTPSRFKLLINSTENLSFFKKLSIVMIGGEPLPAELITFFKNYPNIKLYNMYGPTETTVWSSIKAEPCSNHITIGTPIGNTQIYILDSHKNLLPYNTPGEIYIGGSGLANGYFNNNELTVKSFVTSPFDKNKFLYKTGDLGYIQENGEIVHLGRIDSQTKINGFRVEISEIENTILSKKEIKEVVVTYTDKTLTAYYISDSTINNNELANYLYNKLPYYMVPKIFYKLDKMPLTPNGKIDKKALPKVSLNSVKNEKVMPRNSIDTIIIDFLQNRFNTTNISIIDSITELGADSLTAIELSVLIQREIGINISVKDIFTHPIISDLSDFILQKSNKNTTLNINKVEENEYYPASSAQKRVYYASQADENSTLYNIAGGILLEKIPDANKLEKCLKELINRHSSLRTYFAIVNDDLVQKIVPNLNFNLNVQTANWNDREKLIKEFIKPFNLLKAPLFRIKLITFENKKAMLLIDMHHSISDGTSLSIFLNELCLLYNGESLEDKKIDYKDYTGWENNYFKSKEYEEDKKYWLNEFPSEIPALDMPCIMQRPARQSFEGDSFHFSLDEELSKELLNIAKSENITPYMLLLAAYFILLYKYTGEDDIVVGTPIMNRENHNLENVLGMFVNNLALRTKINSSKNIQEFLQEIKTLCLNGFSHQNYPFNNLIKDLNLKRDISRNPIFDTMFIYQNNGYEPVKFDNSYATYVIPDLKISKFDFSLEVIPTANNFEMRFEYCTKLFTKEYMEKMAVHYKNIVTYLINNLTSPVAKINMLTKEEENKILHEFNNTYMPYNKQMPLITLFESQVEKHLNETAIIFEDSHITYSYLNERANGLANILIEKYHIQKNQVVGILLKRSVETIISVLAVLKAGGTYLLIDESLPFDRILYMLENSNSALLITDYGLKNIDFSNKLMLSEIDFEKCRKNNPNINSSNDDGFCIIYTSGSTGTPKGVLLKRIGVLNMLLNYKKVLKTDNCNNFLSISSISFDMFIVENFVPLLSGKTVVLSNEEEQKIPLYSAKLITKYKVDFILTTPTRMNLLLENIKDSDVLNNIKVIQLGGEIFTLELYKKLKNVTHACIYNGYGPSEATACSSSKLVNSSDVTIGKPFYNVQIYICNKDLNLMPIGFPGEICISGDGIGKGYIHNDTLTKQAFIKNPFGDGTLYKTGDLAYYKENGEIEYIGRRDFQIKIRGLRVELSEIEKQMLKLPNITNVAVIYNSNPQYIAAFYTASCEKNISEMRNALSKALPLYMVPKYFVHLKELPITPNGKIDKKQLQNYSINKQESENNYVAPQTEKQKLFCEIWSELLNQKIGIEDNVFECGADSLIAIKFKTELLSYKINIPYSNIFDFPTVKELAENCSQVVKKEKEYDYSAINKILEKNSVQNIKKNEIQKNTNNNILLLGSNGFVGAHILYSFIKNDNGIAYCIVRNKKDEDAYNRLISILHFYFENELDSYINNRIVILTGNVLEENFGLTAAQFNSIIKNISTVINAAAIVKHYGDEKKFKEINVDLTQKIADVCQKYNKRFLHISTISVYGDSKLDMQFSEKSLYIGQNLDNIYIRTKFEAEKIILEKIANGLNAQILRLGNITSRYADGTFQINADSNAFINRLKSFIELGIIPESFMKMPLEFTPVDLCANAIIDILQNYIPNISVLHLYNDKFIYMKKLVNMLKLNGFNLEPVSNKKFEEKVQKILENDNKEILSGIVVDMNENTNINYTSHTILNSEFSKFILNLIGFNWNVIDDTYLEKYINYLRKIKFI